MLEARLDRLKQRIKIDLSTDDVITPSAIRYSYRLMFEDRRIELMAYTPETLLAEKDPDHSGKGNYNNADARLL